MDQNKLAVLKAVPYVIEPSCHFCKWGTFKKGDDWGLCQVHFYTHNKHTGVDMNLSISRFGICPYFETSPSQMFALSEFAPFFNDPKPDRPTAEPGPDGEPIPEGPAGDGAPPGTDAPPKKERLKRKERIRADRPEPKERPAPPPPKPKVDTFDGMP